MRKYVEIYVFLYIHILVFHLGLGYRQSILGILLLYKI